MNPILMSWGTRRGPEQGTRNKEQELGQEPFLSNALRVCSKVIRKTEPRITMILPAEPVYQGACTFLGHALREIRFSVRA